MIRRFTPVEIALGVSLLCSVAAVAFPVFARELHASRFVEATDGLSRLTAAAAAQADANGRFPDTAPLTPATPPRGTKTADAPGSWDHPTWKVLDFRAAPEGVPHAYAFAFESTGPGFIARAVGDLDGDGIFSTFEMRGGLRPGDTAVIQPGMYVESELE